MKTWQINQTLQIGRSPDNQICLPHALVSRAHARITINNDQIQLEDSSANGTFVNGARVSGSVVLKEQDLIHIGPFRLSLNQKQLSLDTAEGQGQVRLDAVNIRLDASGGKTLLNQVSVHIPAGQVTALLGASGAGKSTLLKVLAGFLPPTSGDVFFNGEPMSVNYQAFRSSVAFVPQDDIIHPMLSVEEALNYASRLRLPEDLTPLERSQQIDNVLFQLELEPFRHTLVKALSGGQRKRVSIGVELLSQPHLLILDEPTSGLDPGLEKYMMEQFQTMSRQGKTILVTTHYVKHLDLCDQIVILAPGGHLVFAGPPRKALSYFQLSDYADIYRLLESQSPDILSTRFEANPLYLQHIVHPQQNLLQRETKVLRKEIRQDRSLGRWTRQLIILTQRYLHILMREGATVAGLLLQAPLIVVLLWLTYHQNLFDLGPLDAPNFDFIQSPSLLFFMVCSALWFGISNATQEIIREFPIFARERLINLHLSTYILSKYLVLGFFCLIQCLALQIGLGLWFKVPQVFEPGFFLILYLTALCGQGIGFCLSAWSDSALKAMSILPLVLIPQIMFSGSIVPVSEMPKASQAISQVTVSYWAYQGLGNLTQISDEKLESHGQVILALPETVRNEFKHHSFQKTGLSLSLWCLFFYSLCLILLGRRRLV
jgi:ABC-type multidrug transport system ATPase subunit